MLELYQKKDGQIVPVDTALLAQIIAALVSQTSVEVKKTTVVDAVKKYEKSCTSQKCISNRNSEKYYFGILKEFLEGQKIVYIDQVELHHMEEFQSLLLEFMCPASVNRRFNTIRNFYQKCDDWGFIVKNPCKKLKNKKEEQNPFRPWPRRVFRRFLKLTSGVHTQLFQFLWATGCRPMEAKNLRWTDINWDTGMITLRCGKNASITRTIPMNDQISKILHSIRPDGLFVFSKNGKHIYNSLLYHYAKDRLKTFTKDNYTVYGIRHAFGTTLNKKGVNAFTIARLMGHAKVETTKRYSQDDKRSLLKAQSLVAL